MNLGEYVSFSSGWLSEFLSSLPPILSDILKVFLFSIAIMLISFFVWSFYRTLSERNFIRLSLSKYNTSEHPILRKVFASLLYIVENVIIFPFLITAWFALFSLFLFVIAESGNTKYLILLSASMVAAIRVLAYFNHSLSADLAKLFPFISLSVFLLSPLWNRESFVMRIGEIPALFHSIIYFLFAVFILEMALRISYTFLFFVRNR